MFLFINCNRVSGVYDIDAAVIGGTGVSFISCISTCRENERISLKAVVTEMVSKSISVVLFVFVVI